MSAAMLGRAFSSGAPTLQATVLVMMSGNAPQELPDLLEQAKVRKLRLLRLGERRMQVSCKQRQNAGADIKGCRWHSNTS